jgi:hypothetical protein
MKPPFTHALTPPSETMRILIEQAKTAHNQPTMLNLIDPATTAKLYRAAEIFSDELPEFEFVVLLFERATAKGGMTTSLPTNDDALLVLDEMATFLRQKSN